jgi:hypothetical protein
MTLWWRRSIVIAVIATFAAYSLYWIMFVPFFGIVLIHGGWNLFYDFTGLDGVMGQAFFWFTVIINPLTILIALGVVVNYVARRMSGDNNVEL